ncbi:hypothetical protein ASPWEDRAFT_26236 [Aspergillus wentii DTO 134E9]|uniref:ER membrane protein complex subunit 2 n=1 Tax=Aspergillus wentii DTO 134E9 TaxID=1073089 RepID=A0A1L9RPK0_ASPWE|nr:uncharacterized protein ASPWEDRAFT_26236 [Aspergillus wentii DTO 134E9]OJJ36783.1 hypothetical protein ASPWEDRAFT_26236 [Aspergillus wentii DTO 134E9]
MHGSHDIHSSDLIATLRFSQQATMILDRHPETSSFFLPSSAPENPEEYGKTEQLFFSSLQTGDDKSAQRCLDRLTQRFGPSNERIMGLHGLYKEAIAEDSSALERCLREYDNQLLENPVNLPVLKRRVALLCAMSRPTDAITALIKLIETTPTDAEAWCELSSLYQSQGMYSQAIFSLEEVLLITPNAWNIHACLGELLYICASSPETQAPHKLLARSLRFFCRSIELCDNYLRGLYGLTLVSSLLLQDQHSKYLPQDHLVAQPEDTPLKSTILELNAVAVKKLHRILQAQPMNYQGREYSQSELIAAKELLNQFHGSH